MLEIGLKLKHFCQRAWNRNAIEYELIKNIFTTKYNLRASNYYSECSFKVKAKLNIVILRDGYIHAHSNFALFSHAKGFTLYSTIR